MLAYALKGSLPRVPVRARHAEWSVISSADDLYVRPNGELVELLLRAATLARTVDLSEIAARSSAQEAVFVRTWPGEHYRLLTALATALPARKAVEIGTYRGHSALALAAGLAPGGKVVTYDVVPWREVDGAILRLDDLNRLEQRIGDLSDVRYLETELDTLRSADLIFLDGPKDGIFEPNFCRAALSELTDRPRLVVFDDIRVMTMIRLWRDLPYAKLDATSLGHWSGTGLLMTA
jgi:predicted O-methyltransferase YrrM